jgi:hypothetical protein
VTTIVIGMVLIVVVALVVISVISEDEDELKSRPAPKHLDESSIDDLLHE